MKVEVETTARKTESGWADQDGFVGPFRPGNGPRNDPRGDFPTGPEVGEKMPNVQCRDSRGQTFDLHADRGNTPAVFMFFALLSGDRLAARNSCSCKTVCKLSMTPVFGSMR